MNQPPPCVVHEDEHLLVVAKPAGWNTHAADPWAGEGIYEWLRDREPRWAELAIVHRLDRDTSGVLVFARSGVASRALGAQFAARTVQKRYHFLTATAPSRLPLTVETGIKRQGDRYVAAAAGVGDLATTDFVAAPPAVAPLPGTAVIEARPLTGRTHQIRVHAALQGMPVLGDPLYGGAPAPRLYLHASAITLLHPTTGAELTFTVPPDFAADRVAALRAALLRDAGADATTAFRLAHGAADGWPGARVDRLGDFVLHQAEVAPDEAVQARLAAWPARGSYHKTLDRQLRRRESSELSPQLLDGEAAPPRFTVQENGVAFELSLSEGYSTGLFLDQRDNRRRLLTGHVAAGFELPALAGGTVLNAFAYTCAFSVCAARAGAVTTSLDLSRKYLDWGRRNFELNGLDPAAHDFIYGDAFDWLRRLARKDYRYDVVLLDPPTFSQSKARGVFRAEADYGRLVAATMPLLAPGGVLLAATNAARLAPAEFVATVSEAIRVAGRSVLQQHYAPQPPDFPASREDPAYLKTLWLRVG
jgi:23S rRNA (cytosine1962-C5)-methyltransferase